MTSPRISVSPRLQARAAAIFAIFFLGSVLAFFGALYFAAQVLLKPNPVL